MQGQHQLTCSQRHHARAYKRAKPATVARLRLNDYVCPPRDAPRTFCDIPYATIPDVHDVVIAAARKQFTTRSPLESAHFTAMSKELHHFVPCDTHVMVPYASIAAGRTQYMTVPAERGNLRLVPAHRAQLLSALGERDCNDVLHGPRNQIQVEIAGHSWSVKHAFRLRRDLP